MPIKFVPYKNHKDVFLLKSVYPGYEEKWISFTGDGNAWLYAWYDNEADAMPVKFKKCKQNNTGSFKGNCYKMQNFYGDSPGKWISFTADETWMRAYYNEADAMTICLEEFLIIE